MNDNKKLMLEAEIDKKFFDGYNFSGIRSPSSIPKIYSVDYEKESVKNISFNEDIIYTLRFVIEKKIQVPDNNSEIFKLVHETLKSGIMNEVYGEIKNELIDLNYNFSHVLGKYGRDPDLVEIYKKIKDLIKLMEGDQ